MTDNTQEIDKIFTKYTKQVIDMCHGNRPDVADESAKAKQAITSLIKELVAEAINSECIALLNDLEEEQDLCCSNHHKNSETFVPFVSLDVIQKAKEKYF